MKPKIAIWLGTVLLLAGLALWFGHQQQEVPVAAWLHAAADGRSVPAIIAVTRMGGAAALIPFALAVVLMLVLRGAQQAGLWLFAAIGSGRIAIELLKETIGRVRPDAAGHLVDVSSASFPSSHAAGSMLTVATMLLLFRTPPTPAAACLIFPILVGLSRLALGVHWPSDVLAGWGFGLLWAGLFTFLVPSPFRDRA
ncbi:phosphatase PAP2 family protein [Sphingomonas montanisoli]|uniref:Phosphatase PAP2 family protein n=1 Tax=Sphingomonas montanisoli TaxID=2606412 RepID=A0A5D9CH83_9SPHN|nr:phosphatase PAP2 family protein [Sphingomonas montanisoli]TZG29445.1 phosphatase PAP2 family protein [Sphingomonas montanisoli]